MQSFANKDVLISKFSNPSSNFKYQLYMENGSDVVSAKLWVNKTKVNSLSYHPIPHIVPFSSDVTLFVRDQNNKISSQIQTKSSENALKFLNCIDVLKNGKRSVISYIPTFNTFYLFREIYTVEIGTG